MGARGGEDSAKAGRWKMYKRFKKPFCFITGILLGLTAALMFFGDNIASFIIFHPWTPAADWKATAERCEEVRFETADGGVLHGLYFPHENSRGVVLYSHGNGDNVKTCEHLGTLYRERLGVSILIYDYRGYGFSEGKPTARGILEDGRAARKFLAQRENVEESEILQMGFSLGGAVAIDLASRDGARGLIVQSSFTSLVDMGKKLFPVLPVGLFLREKLDSRKKIGDFHGPVFISHGTRDSVVPYKQGESLYRSANEPKTFYPVEEGDHTPPPEEFYLSEIRQFLDGFLLGSELK